MESPEATYFRKKYNSLSSAWRRFTVLFGMGRSGSALLWPPGLKLSAPVKEPIRIDLLHLGSALDFSQAQPSLCSFSHGPHSRSQATRL